MKPLKIHKLKSKKKGEGLLRRLSKKTNAKKSSVGAIKASNKRRRSTFSSLEEMGEKIKTNSKSKKVKNTKGKSSVKNEKTGKKSKKNAPTKITKLINYQESLEKEVIPKIIKEDKIEKKVSFSNLIEKQMHPRVVDETEDEEENITEKQEKPKKVSIEKQTNLINDYVEYFEKNKPTVKDPTQFAIRKHLSVIGMKYPKRNSVSFFSDEYLPKAITARPSRMEPKLEDETYLERSSFYDNDANFKSWMKFNKAQSIILQDEDLQINNFVSNKNIKIEKTPQPTKKKKTSKGASRRRKLKNRHSTVSSSYEDKEGTNRGSFSLNNNVHANKKFGKVKRKRSIGSEKSKSKRKVKTGVTNKKSIGTEYEVISHKKSISKEVQGKQKQLGKHISLEMKKTIEKETKEMVEGTEQQKIEKQDILENETKSNTNENIQKELSDEVKIEMKYESMEETVTERLRKIKAAKKGGNQEKKEQQEEQIENSENEETNKTQEGNDTHKNKQDSKVTHELKELMEDMKEEHDQKEKEKENIAEEENTEAKEINETNKEERMPLTKKGTTKNLYNDIKQSFSFMDKKAVHHKKSKEVKTKKTKKTKKTDSRILLKDKNVSENYSEHDPMKTEADIIIKKYLFAKEKARRRRKSVHLFDLNVNHSEVKVSTINMFSKIEPTTCFNDILFFMDNYKKKQKKYNDIFDFFKSTFKKQYYELEGVQAVLQIFDVLIKKLMKDLGTHNIQPYFTDTLIEKIKNYEINREMEKKLFKNLGKGKFRGMDPNNKYMKEMGLLDVIMGSDIFDAYGVKNIRYKCNRKLYLNTDYNENPLPVFLIKDWQNQEKLALFKQKIDELKRRKAIRMAHFPNTQRNQQVVCCLSGLLSCFKNNCSNFTGCTTVPPSRPVHTEKFHEYFICNKNQNHMEKRSTLSMKDVSYILAL